MVTEHALFSRNSWLNCTLHTISAITELFMNKFIEQLNDVKIHEEMNEWINLQINSISKKINGTSSIADLKLNAMKVVLNLGHAENQ